VPEGPLWRYTLPNLARIVTLLFFGSGAAGLVYQVLWMRTLGLFLGSDMYGVAIVLAAFMGGLALGSLVGGRLAERTERPLLWYGLAEVGIGLAALALRPLLHALEPLLAQAYPAAHDGATHLYLASRVGVAIAALLVPTALMGATLPLILRQFARDRAALGRTSAHFYAVNTLGALTGTLAAGFVLLPYLGMARTTQLIAGLNLAIGLACVALGRGLFVERVTVDARAVVDGGDRPDSRRARTALAALCLSGFASFGFEVVWTRVLLISFSATVYSFAAMLACFLLGIFLGSLAVRRHVDTHPEPLALLGRLQLGVGASVALLALLVNAVPGVFGHLLGATSYLLGEARGAALVVSTLLASFLLLIVPTSLLGATFPVGLRVYTTSIAKVGSSAGNLYAANTFGAIAGSLVTGLFIIPALGTRPTFALLAALFSMIGWGCLHVAGEGRSLLRHPIGALAFAATLAAGVTPLMLPYRVTLNFNQTRAAETELLYHAEGIQNTIDVDRSKRGVTRLVIGGNVEADDGYVQRRHFVLKGHLPLLFLERPRTALVIGLGMGITLDSTTRHPGIERIDVVELSPEILAAHQVLRDINRDVARNPLVHIRIDDGRSFLRHGEGTFDMITADPIHPKVSRVGYLYTREYYASIAAHLAPEGVVCQWMPLYQVAPKRLRSAMASFAAVFPNATFWYVKNHGLFIARKDDATLDYRIVAQRFEDPEVRADLASIDIHTPEDLLSLMLLGPDEVRAFLAVDRGVPLNTDDFPYLEHFVPRDLFYAADSIMAELVPFAIDPAKYVSHQPEDSQERVRALCAGRAERFLGELRAPR